MGVGKTVPMVLRASAAVTSIFCLQNLMKRSVSDAASARRAATRSASPPMSRSKRPTTAHNARSRTVARRPTGATRASLISALPPGVGSTQWAKSTRAVSERSQSLNSAASASRG